LIFFAAVSSIDVTANGDVHEDVLCDEGKEVVFKPSDGSSICVKSSSVENFVKRGYTVPILAQEPLRIGLLFSTTGDYSTYGIESQFAALQGIDDFNEHLKSLEHEEFSLIPEIVYLSTNPEYTLEQVKKLHADGVDVFIGPETSAELAMIKPYVDSEELLVISTSSTAPSLAVEDSIYRLVPDDTNQGKLISTLLEKRDVTTVFLLVRDDIWGNGLANAIQESYSGNISQISYDPNDPLYDEKIQELSDLVAAEESLTNIAIGVISFGEVSEFLLLAADYDNLDEVQWFGTDSNANEKKIIEDEKISSFAEKVSFRAIQFASDYNSPIHKDVESKLYLKLDYLPSTYAFAAYDAVWLLGLSMLDVESIDATDIESTIQDTSQFYTGGLGELTFNDAGDLVSDNYDVWFIQEGQWYKEPANFVESALKDVTEKTEDTVVIEKTDETELPQKTEDEVTIPEQSSSTEEDVPVLVIGLIVGILVIVVFAVWKIKKPKIHLKNL
jgi:branched-chain amino acid transport system substrate-binding protein